MEGVANLGLGRKCLEHKLLFTRKPLDLNFFGKSSNLFEVGALPWIIRTTWKKKPDELTRQ